MSPQTTKPSSLFVFAREHKFVTAGVLAGIIIAVSLILRLLTPPAPPTPEVVTKTVFTPVFLRFRAQAEPIEVSLSPEVSVDRAKLTIFESLDYQPEAFTSTAAQTFGLTPAKRLANVYYSDDYSVSISTTTTPGLLHYADDTKVAAPGTTITETQAEAFATDFMRKLAYPVEQLVLDSATYVDPENEGDITLSTSLRSILMLVYSRKLEGLDFSITTNNEQKVFIFVSSLGVSKAYLPALTFSVGSAGETDLIPLTTAADQVAEGNFILLSQPNAILTGSKIQSLAIDQALLEYRYDENQKLFIPFYQLTGKAVFTNGDSGIIVVSTPAIALL